MGDALQLLFSQVSNLLSVFVERWIVAKQVEEIGDRCERIVDLMCDDPSDPAHGGELLRLPQRLLGAKLSSGVSNHFKNGVAFVVQCLPAGHDDFGSIFRPLTKISIPRSSISERSLHNISRNRKFRSQKSVKIFSKRLVPVPAIEVLRS